MSLMVFNVLILCLHVAVLSGMSLGALRFGKECLIAWIAVLAVAMNLFVLKQITLFGLFVTSSDALAVGYLLGLNLIQEFFGKNAARKAAWISFFTSCGFALLSQITLAYTPNHFDCAQSYFLFLFSPTPRLIIASLASFLIVQLVDLAFFQFLREKTKGNYLTFRMILVLCCSQILDTIVFSFLGLYGLVGSIFDVIILSMIIKVIITLLSAPFTVFAKSLFNICQESVNLEIKG